MKHTKERAVRKNKQSWRKPRFYRSDPTVTKDKIATKETKGIVTGPDHCTRWKPISREVFDDLVEKGLLSKTQIEQYLAKEKQRSMDKAYRAAKSKAKKDKDLNLIIEISKLDMLTLEGAIAFGKILKEHPKAASLIGKAQKLRAAK
jgi:hypothetical protein